MFALIDCNNFYASCERAFNPKLIGRPIVVLSNNDGCVVARSDEAKALNIPMAAPAFKYKEVFEKYNVAVFSGNYSLYGDMSHRVMKVLINLDFPIELYSIDEAFIEFPDNFQNPVGFFEEVRKKIKMQTGITVSIGIGKTKTLAKVANHIAKKPHKFLSENECVNGVYFIENEIRKNLFEKIPVEEVWGIGFRLRELLNKNGIYCVLDFINQSPEWVRANMSVNGLRTQSEILGIVCYKLNSKPEPRKNILSSRSFGKNVTNFKEIAESVATYTFRATEKLRKEKEVASFICVYIRTNKHKIDQEQYSTYKILALDFPTDDIFLLTKKALIALKEIYKSGYSYKKAGVSLLGLMPKTFTQMNFFHTNYNSIKNSNISKTIDKINSKFGPETIKNAAMGTSPTWRGKKTLSSPSYTTNWDEILKIKI